MNRKHETLLIEIAHQAMIDKGLAPDFDGKVQQQLAGIRGPAREQSDAIRDLRELAWCSIDNDDSRDLDQLTDAELQPDRSVKILVAIADVDVLVTKDSALDAHAHNTTSVYTAGDLFPMLPEELSTDLTSLGEGQDRLAVVVEMVIAEDGAVLRSTLSGAGALPRQARV